MNREKFEQLKDNGMQVKSACAFTDLEIYSSLKTS